MKKILALVLSTIFSVSICSTAFARTVKSEDLNDNTLKLVYNKCYNNELVQKGIVNIFGASENKYVEEQYSNSEAISSDELDIDFKFKDIKDNKYESEAYTEGTFTFLNVKSTFEAKGKLEKFSLDNNDTLYCGALDADIIIKGNKYPGIIGVESINGDINKTHVTMSINTMSSSEGIVLLDFGKSFMDKKLIDKIKKIEDSLVQPNENISKSKANEQYSSQNGFSYTILDVATSNKVTGNTSDKNKNVESVVLSVGSDNNAKRINARVWSRTSQVSDAFDADGILDHEVTVTLANDGPYTNRAWITHARPYKSSSTSSNVESLAWSALLDVISTKFAITWTLDCVRGISESFKSKVTHSSNDGIDYTVKFKAPYQSGLYIDLDSSVDYKNAVYKKADTKSGLYTEFKLDVGDYTDIPMKCTANIKYQIQYWDWDVMTSFYVNSGNAEASFDY